MLLCFKVRALFFGVALLSCQLVWANFSLSSLKQVAIFPARGVEDAIVDELWWQVREDFASDGRFEVATRRLMINRQVLNPRSELKPADAVILGRVLEADLLVTHYIMKKKAILIGYRATDGVIVAREEVSLNPSIPDSDQVIPLFKSLARKFVGRIPYAGYQVVSPKSQKLTEFDGSLGYSFVMIPRLENFLNKKIFWVNSTFSTTPILDSRPIYQIVNTGIIVESLGANIYRVQIDKLNDESMFKSDAIVFLAEKSEEELGSDINFQPKISEFGAEYLVKDLSVLRPIKSQSPQSTFVGFVLSIGAILLIAL